MRSKSPVDRIPLEDLEKALTEETLEELCERRFTIPRIAEFLGEPEDRVSEALNEYGLETFGHAPKSNTVAATLEQADDFDELRQYLEADEQPVTDGGRSPQARAGDERGESDR